MLLEGDRLDSPAPPLGDLLRIGLDAAPEEIAISSAVRALSWRELDKAGAALAGGYRGLGLEPGDRIASLMPNRVDLVVHYLACFRAGLIATPLNYRYTDREIDHALEVSGARVLLAHVERAEDVAASRLASTIELRAIAYRDPEPLATGNAEPGGVDGGEGTLLPLVNFDYLTGVPADGETAAPWSAQPDFYEARCKRRDGAHWLNISKVGLPGDDRPDLGAIVASGTNYHVPEVNLAEGNLLTIAQLQVDTYESAQARIAKLESKLAKQKQRRAALLEKAERLEQNGDAAGAKRALRGAKAAKRKIRSLKKKLAALEG